MFRLRFLFCLGVLFFVIVLTAYFFYNLQPVRSEDSNVNIAHFKIVKGEGFREISSRLSQKSLIRSISIFKLYSILLGKAQKFQPGVYELTPSQSIPEIVDVLSRGGRNEVTLTFPEGTTLKDMNTTLIDSGILNGTDSLLTFSPTAFTEEYPFLNGVTSFEGFLFPDTYRFKIHSTAEEVLKTFLETFKKKAWSLLQNHSDWHERLTLASYLEREVIEFEDRQIVAGILRKRVLLQMPLQVDATISYAKCNGATHDCASAIVTKKDLTIMSLYNTYQRLGWTPTPIANPGQSAISAALQPKTSSYLYYLSAKDTKETFYSRTLEEHNLKRARYL